MTAEQLVNGRFFNNIKSVINKLNQTKISSPKQSNPIDRTRSSNHSIESCCTVHPATTLTYYCHTCVACICSDCVILDQSHSAHHITKLSDVYNTHLQLIQSELQLLIERRTSIKQIECDINHHMLQLKQIKDSRTIELQQLFACAESNLQQQLKEKLLELLNDKTDALKEIELCDNIIDELQHTIRYTRNHPSILIEKTGSYMDILQHIHKKDVQSLCQHDVDNEFNNDLVTDFITSTFKFPLNNQHSLLLSDIDDNIDIDESIIYSDPLIFAGYTFRLKIYTNGTGVAKSQFLSVFLELTDHSSSSVAIIPSCDTNQFEYSVTIHHHNDAQRDVTRTFQSHFERSECWGYAKFYRLDNIIHDGYLDDNQHVSLTYRVRAPTYMALTRCQNQYIQQLESNTTLQNNQIMQLQDKISELLNQAQMCADQVHHCYNNTQLQHTVNTLSVQSIDTQNHSIDPIEVPIPSHQSGIDLDDIDDHEGINTHLCCDDEYDDDSLSTSDLIETSAELTELMACMSQINANHIQSTQ